MKLSEIELMEYSERAVIYIYNRRFSENNSHNKEDLMQEAYLNILCEYRNAIVDNNTFKSRIPKYAFQGMIKYLRKRYHTSKTGYLETSINERDIRSDLDYSIQERILFMDIWQVARMKGYRGSTFKDLTRILSIIILLYVGYSFKELAEIINSDRGNICRSAKRFGRRLLSAWAC